jgi:hypothetical protein
MFLDCGSSSCNSLPRRFKFDRDERVRFKPPDDGITLALVLLGDIPGYTHLVKLESSPSALGEEQGLVCGRIPREVDPRELFCQRLLRNEAPSVILLSIQYMIRSLARLMGSQHRPAG